MIYYILVKYRLTTFIVCLSMINITKYYLLYLLPELQTTYNMTSAIPHEAINGFMFHVNKAFKGKYSVHHVIKHCPA